MADPYPGKDRDMPVAIVTGSDSGIGKATAVVLAERGFDVGITWNTDREGAEGTAAEVRDAGRRAEVRQIDVSRVALATAVLDDLADSLGGLDVFVNNAGTGASSPFLDLSLEDWQHTIDVDLTGPFVLAQRAARRMVDAGTRGRIVNVTSVHEHVPLKESAAYCAAKGGLGLLTKTMALELAEHGITVNSVAPGEIATPMTGQHDVDPSTQDRPRIPLQRPGDAREIAGIIGWLASDESSYTTGSSFVVDGGLLLMAAVRD
jgi:NAD(P)-dependent dehydrogenase (short-subunit alcohol dehydrogenase family)